MYLLPERTDYGSDHGSFFSDSVTANYFDLRATAVLSQLVWNTFIRPLGCNKTKRKDVTSAAQLLKSLLLKISEDLSVEHDVAQRLHPFICGVTEEKRARKKVRTKVGASTQGLDPGRLNSFLEGGELMFSSEPESGVRAQNCNSELEDLEECYKQFQRQ